MVHFFRPILRAAVMSLGLISPLTAFAEGRSIIVLDASGSMWGQIDGRAKLEIAREALGTVLNGLPADTELGLIAYGHRTKGDCGDIELVVPPATGTAAAITQAAQDMKFLGKTPLTEAVRQAAAALKSTEDKATVILITDGIETCAADPCALGAELEASGVDFTAHVVGFGLTEEEGQQVACLAENTGGQYIQAKDAGSLVAALKTTVAVAEPVAAPVAEPEPAPVAALEFNIVPHLFLAEGGPEVIDQGQAYQVYQIAANGTPGERLTTEYNQYRGLLAAGSYRIVARLGEAQVEQDVTVTDDALLEPKIVLNAGTLIIHPKGSADGPVESSAAVQIANAAGLSTTFYGDTTVIVPAMETQVTVKVGEGSTTEAIILAPGETVEKDMIAGVGLAVVDAFYVDGMIMDTTQHFVEILAAKQALDGSRASITSGYGPAQNFSLPPGDYIARVGQDAAVSETAFRVETGARVDVKAVLNAGVLAVTATGASSIEVFEAKADISGNRKSLTFEYAEATSLVVPGGDYLIVAKRGEASAQATATVTPGARSEIAVP